MMNKNCFNFRIEAGKKVNAKIMVVMLQIRAHLCKPPPPSIWLLDCKTTKIALYWSVMITFNEFSNYCFRLTQFDSVYVAICSIIIARMRASERAPMPDYRYIMPVSQPFVFPEARNHWAKLTILTLNQTIE